MIVVAGALAAKPGNGGEAWVRLSWVLGLRRLGVGRGDVVSWQLPNWWQVVALHLACVRIGAVSNIVMPVFRERELEFMLGLAESKVFIVPRLFRGHDHAAMAAFFG